MARIVKAKLSGPDAQLGAVAASDVARLIIGLERALARAAYVALGSTRDSHGRHRAAIENASRLRLIGVEAGSVVELLALPESSAPSVDQLPIAVGDLSVAALEELMRVLDAASDDVDSGLAQAVAQLGDELGIGERHDKITLFDSGTDPDSNALSAGIVDREVRRRMHALSRRPIHERDDTVVGTLVEADFERRTARLQPTLGPAVTVTFTEAMDDDLYAALRSPSRLRGQVRYDARTSAARAIEVRRVSRAEQLALGSREFFEGRTVDELARDQGVFGPVEEPSELSDADLVDEERDAFLAAMTQM